jgi:hypothetical protein
VGTVTYSQKRLAARDSVVIPDPPALYIPEKTPFPAQSKRTFALKGSPEARTHWRLGTCSGPISILDNIEGVECKCVMFIALMICGKFKVFKFRFKSCPSNANPEQKVIPEFQAKSKSMKKPIR